MYNFFWKMFAIKMLEKVESLEGRIWPLLTTLFTSNGTRPLQYTRQSIAYDKDGAEVTANTPVYDDGKVTKHKKDGSKANKKYSYGFSAQELVEALKDTDLDIVDDADPDQLAVREGKLVPVLVKAVQELAAEVEQLKEVK